MRHLAFMLCDSNMEPIERLTKELSICFSKNTKNFTLEEKCEHVNIYDSDDTKKGQKMVS